MQGKGGREDPWKKSLESRSPEEREAEREAGIRQSYLQVLKGEECPDVRISRFSPT